jgi:DNA processing protein
MSLSFTCSPKEMSPTQNSDADERLAYIALALTPKLGAQRLAALLSAFGSAAAAIELSHSRHPSTDKMLVDAMRLARTASVESAQDQIRTCADRGIEMLLPFDNAFPVSLRSIPGPPTLLYARGKLDFLAAPAVAVIGSRDPTQYGCDVARMVATASARAGLAVVSGMARGLDAVAHAAALDCNGMTIGVLGGGIGYVYPASNRALYARVEADGLLVSECVPDEQPMVGAFPRRNRIISGLAQVVVVVEAADASGTLVTVNCALEQGRSVLAAPGPLTSPTSVGTNRMIRDGAQSLLTMEDILEHFNVGPVERAVVAGDAPDCSLSAEEALVYNATNCEARPVDHLAEATGMPIGRLLGLLCGLELGGLVEQLPGGLFRRPVRG